MTDKEIKEEFSKYDLDLYSRWSVGDGIQHVLPPLSLDKNLGMLKIKDKEYTRVDFRLFAHEGLIFFHEFLSDKKYGFDIKDISLDKIYFRVTGSKGVIWTRLPLKSSDNLLSYFQ